MTEVTRQFGCTNLILLRGDITREKVDAIVNAANSGLRGGGGVDGAIHRAGGPQIMEECNVLRQMEGGCRPGHAVITGGGKLSAQYVIHAVGPIWHGGTGDERATLASTYKTSLSLAVRHDLKSIAFPSISTGAYGYPVDEAAKIAIETVADFCKSEQSLDEIRFVLFDDFTFTAYKHALDSLATTTA